MKRRQLLAGLTPFITTLAGCTPDYPPQKRIDVGSIQVEEREGRWAVHLSVENRNTMSDERADFQDVQFVGYDADRKLVCEEYIGELPGMETVQERDITVECERFPEIITFDAEESPCESEVDIVILYFDRIEDGQFVWDATHNRRCGEGLPPEPRE